VVGITSDPDNDLTLQMTGTFTFADNTVSSLSQDLVLAAEDAILEACECFEATIATGGLTAADELGAVGSTEICVLDEDGLDGESK